MIIPEFTRLPKTGMKAMTGYVFDGAYCVNREAFRRLYDWGSEEELDNRICDACDNFWDGYESLATTPDGQLYHVMFHWETKEPLIWCPVRREEEADND